MASDDKIVIEFDGDIKQLKAKLSSVKKEVSGLDKLSGAIRSGIGVAAKAGAVAFGGLTAAIGGAVSQAAKFETITTQFETLTGSAQQATKVVRELQDFTAKTPFQFDSVSQAGRQLLAFGVSVDDLQDKLRAIGDVSSSSGKDISELAVIFGQIRSQSRLTGERLNQLVEAGVPIGPALAKTMGVAESAVRSLVSRGEVDFKTFEKAFNSLSEEGGFAFEGMIKQSQTLSGLFSTVSDNVSLLAADLGRELLPFAKELTTQFLGFVQSLRDSSQFMELFKSVLGGTINIGLEVVKTFEILGKRIGAIMATVSESVAAALNLNFKQAAQIFKDNNKAFREDVLAIEQEYAEKSKAIDESLRNDRDVKQEEEKQKTKANAQEIAQIKAQAKIEEAEILREVEAEIAEKQFESEAAKLDRINELTKQKLQEKFDAKRAVEQEDIKAAIKENQLRQKEEVRFGKAQADARAFFRSQEVEGTRLLLDNLATLGRSGNKELGAIAKAAAVARAIMNTAEGVTKALSYGPFLGPALAGAIGTAGAVQIATIQAQRFADGGMYTGGMVGVDSLPAMLQSGELVVPKRNFEEVVNAVSQAREFEETGGQQSVEVTVGFTDDAFEIIEQKLLERRDTGVGSL